MLESTYHLINLLHDLLTTSSLNDEKQATQKALQTVVAGQQSENLLNFDDPATDEQPSGIAATAALAATPAAANLLSGTSSNPLDDLVSIFGNVSMASTTVPPQQNVMGSLGGLSFGATPMAPSPVPSQTPSVLQPASPAPSQPQQAQDDLLGLF